MLLLKAYCLWRANDRLMRWQVENITPGVAMTKSNFSRREFLEVSAAAAGGSLAAKSILLSPEPLQAPRRTAPSDTIHFGMIGVGMQGSGLLGTSITIPGVECAAAADLYDGRHTLAREIVRPDLPVTRHYRELLDNKNIDCIVAAVPDHWHRQVVIDAVSAGKDIYCEKPMSHSAADGVAMVDAAKIRPERGNIRRHSISLLKPLIGIRGRGMSPSARSILWFLRAGAAGKNTGPGWRENCS